jgi:hypothetical protein
LHNQVGVTVAVSEPVPLAILDALPGLVRTARSSSHLRHEQLGATGVTLAVLKRLAQEPARSGDVLSGRDDDTAARSSRVWASSTRRSPGPVTTQNPNENLTEITENQKRYA